MKRIIAYILFLTAAIVSGCNRTGDAPQPSVELSSSFAGASVSGSTLSFTAPFSGCTVDITVDCNWSWDYSVQSGSWYAVELTDNGLSVLIPENTLQDDRDGIIVIRSSNETGIAEGYIKVSQGRAADPELSVELDGDDTDILLPAEGGSYRVKVSSNTEWFVRSGSEWLEVSLTADGFEVVADSYVSTSIRSTDVTVVTTGDEHSKSVVVNVSQLSSVEALVFEITTDKTSSRMGVLPFGDEGTINCIVDWGDGTVQKVSSPWPQHFYFDDGVYEVRVLGKVASIDSDPNEFPEKFSRCVTAVKSWGDVGLENLENAFISCNRLKSVAAPGENAFSGVKSIDGMFLNCTSLTDIPEGLFRNMTGITSARSVFDGCTSLKSVPSDIFSGCTALEDLSSLFEGCISLEEVPAVIFDDCKNILNVSRAFFGCSSLKGESPYTSFGDMKIHLYERDGSNSLSAIQEYSSCFGGCTGLDDYGVISSGYPGWK